MLFLNKFDQSGSVSFYKEVNKCEIHFSKSTIYYACVQWYTNIVQGSTNGTIGNTIGNNGTIGKDRW